MSRRRITVLALVQVGIALHFIQWKLTGSTISPVEPSEAMQTLETGRINAGFIFFILAIISTLIVGRFFCGWGCHILFLQDGCTLLMRRFGIRPRAFRSRLLWWTPSILALYMFVWPTVRRVLVQPFLLDLNPDFARSLGLLPSFPGFELHLTETEFWQTFPTIAIAIPFLFICGFAVVYFLGSKGFCTYGCPYGGAFTLAERFSPAKIVADLNACEGCGHCTATCTSNVRVHEEIQIHSKVIDTGCMKCMDCVSVCPNGALSFAFTTPAPRARAAAGPKRRYDLTWKGELALMLTFWGSFVSVRGIYGVVPMLMAVGVALCTVFFVWKLGQLLLDENVTFHRTQFKKHGSWRTAGIAFGAVSVVWIALIAHSGVVTANSKLGAWYDGKVDISREEALATPVEERPAAVRDAADRARTHLRRLRPIGSGGLALLPSDGLDLRLAWLDLVRGDYSAAREVLEHRIEADGASDFLVRDVAHLHILEGHAERAIDLLDRTLDEFPSHRNALDLRARLATRTGESDLMVNRYRAALAVQPDDLELRVGLAGLLLQLHRPAEAEVELKRGLEVREDPRLYQGLAESYGARGRHDEGRAALAKAQELLNRGGSR